MIRDVILPEIGVEGSAVQIAYWHFQEGATIVEGQELLEVSTDKAAVSIPSPASGVLKKINSHEGESVHTGSVLALIDEG